MNRSVIVMVALVTLAADARGSDGEDDTVVSSYRRQTLVADTVGLTILGAGFIYTAARSETTTSHVLGWSGIIASTLAAPVVHAVRGHYKRAVVGAGIRLGLAGSGMAIGATLAGCDGLRCNEGAYMGTGLVIGFVAAAIIDAVVYTDEPVPRARTAGWAPHIAPSRGGAQLGVVGMF